MKEMTGILHLMAELQATRVLAKRHKPEFDRLQKRWLTLALSASKPKRIALLAADILASNELKAAHQKELKHLRSSLSKAAMHLARFDRIEYDFPVGTKPQAPLIVARKLSQEVWRSKSLSTVKPHISAWHYRTLDRMNSQLSEHAQGRCDREWIEGNPLDCECDIRELRGEFFKAIKYCFWVHINRLGVPLTPEEAEVYQYVQRIGPARTRV